MAIQINGNGTITGISVGGLPDGIVDNDMLANTVTTGKVLQVKQTENTGVEYAASLDTFVDIADMSVSITPSAATSKILVMYTLRLSCDSDDNIAHRLLRDSTAIHIGDADSNRERVTGSIRIIGNEKHEMRTESATFLDSPNTTSATTYKIQWCSTFASGNFYLNRSDTDSGSNNDRARAASSITVMEIAA